MLARPPARSLAVRVLSLWGILYFGEIRGTYALALFVISVVVIVGGAALLALFTG
jgi:hypothetical protein